MPTPAWTQRDLHNPHTVEDKARRVRTMFAAIAGSYDLNNRLHSLGLDQHWRRRAVQLAQLRPGDTVVDVACGTGDLTLRFARALAQLHPSPLGGGREGGLSSGSIIGLDFTYEMLPLARAKGVRWNPLWLNGDATRLPLPDASADVISIAFGIRNVDRPAVALAEFYRVLRPGGRLIILEFSLPTQPLIRRLYQFYFCQVLTRTAALIAHDRQGAYQYLSQSVQTFMDRGQMVELLAQSGFADVTTHPLTFGIAVVYRGVRR